MNTERKTNSKNSASEVLVSKMVTSINANGNSKQKVKPLIQPVASKAVCVSNGESVDVSQINFMGIEEFLSVLREKTEPNDKLMHSASRNLAAQLKESRTLLSLASHLSSNDGAPNTLDRLMDTAYFILNASNVFFLQLESNGTDMILIKSRVESAIGMRIAIHEIFPGRYTNSPDYFHHM